MMNFLQRLKSKVVRPHPEYLGFAMRGAYTILALLVSVLLARLLGPEPLGRYYAILAWIILVGTIAQSGWSSFLVREVAALHELGRFAELRGLTRASLHIVGGVSFFAAALLLLISWQWSDRGTFLLCLVGAPAVLLLSTSSLRQAITRGLGRPYLGQLCESLTRPGVQLVGLALLASGLFGLGATPVSAMAIFSLAIAVSALLAYLIQVPQMAELSTGERPILPPREKWVGPLLRTAVMGWAQAINLQVGTIVLSMTATDADVSFFRIAQQLALLLLFGQVVATTLHANEYSRLFVRGDHRGLERLAARAALMGGGIAMSIAGIFIIGGQRLIGEVYGESFQPSFAPLLILIVGQLLNAFFGPVSTVAIATRHESAAMKALLFSVVINVLLCLLLAPGWGSLGAAVGTVVGVASWNLILFLVLRRRLGINVYAGAYFLRSKKP